jgi:phage gpG-like protein
MLTLELDSLSGLDDLEQWAEKLRGPVQNAMAIRLSDIVLLNFGDDGVDRPIPWEPLGPLYAVKYHDGDRTPREVLTGDLQASIDVELGNPEYSRVFSSVEYAAAQQWGSTWGNTVIPPRPFFPLVGDENHADLTPYSESEVRAAAEQAIADAIQSL